MMSTFTNLGVARGPSTPSNGRQKMKTKYWSFQSQYLTPTAKQIGCHCEKMTMLATVIIPVPPHPPVQKGLC